jgi:hypothetical protein
MWVLVSSFFKGTEQAVGMGRWRMVVGWIRADLPSAAEVVDGVLRSRSWRRRGAAPVDGRPPTASSTSSPLKASVRWVFFSSRGCSSSSPVAVAGGEEGGQRRFAEDPGAYL